MTLMFQVSITGVAIDTAVSLFSIVHQMNNNSEIIFNYIFSR